MKKLTILFLLIASISFGQITTAPGTLTVPEGWDYNRGNITLTPSINYFESETIFIGVQSTDEVSPSGRKYILSWKGSDYPTVIYFHGSGQIGKTLNDIRNTAFYKLFYLTNKDNYNFLMPLQYAGKSGWEDYTNGKTSGAWFILEMIEKHSIKKIVATGHSAGASWELPATLQTVLSGWAPVAGRALNYEGVKKMGAAKIPVMAFHGKLDGSWPNTFTAGSQAVSWYKQGGGIPKFIIYEKVYHNSDSYAYRYDSGLKDWIDSLFPVEVQEPGLYLDGKFCGTDSCRVDNHLITIKR